MPGNVWAYADRLMEKYETFCIKTDNAFFGRSIASAFQARKSCLVSGNRLVETFFITHPPT